MAILSSIFGIDPEVEEELRKSIVSKAIAEAAPEGVPPGSLVQVANKFETTVQPEPPEGMQVAKKQDRLPQAGVPAAVSAPRAPFQVQQPLSVLEMLGNALSSGGYAEGKGRRLAEEEAVAGKNATYNALVAKGLDPNTARAVVSNPDLLRSMAPALFGSKSIPEFKLIGKDRYGREQYGWVDAVNQRVNPIDLPVNPRDNPALDDLSGSEYMAQLPRELQERVKGVMEGRLPYPPQNSRLPQNQQILDAISRVDPSFDATVYRARQKTRTDFASGPPANNVTALNTVAQHLDTMDHIVDKLGNWNLPFGTAVREWTNPLFRQIFPASTGVNFQEFDTARQAVGSEMAKAFKGAGVTSVKEMEDWKETLNSAKSDAELKAAIQTGVKLIEGRILEMNDQYQRGFGSPPANPLIGAKAQAIYDRILKRGTGAEENTRGPAGHARSDATRAPSPGGRLRWNPAKGDFE